MIRECLNSPNLHTRQVADAGKSRGFEVYFPSQPTLSMVGVGASLPRFSVILVSVDPVGEPQTIFMPAWRLDEGKTAHEYLHFSHVFLLRSWQRLDPDGCWFRSWKIASSFLYFLPQTSFGRVDLRRLLTDLCRIDDELERISILILLHQLQVNEPFGVCQRFALGKSLGRRLK